MIRAVLDANVVSSSVFGLERETSPPGAILRSWHRGRFELVSSEALIVEVQRTLANAYFGPRLGVGVAHRAVESLRRDATRTPITALVAGIATHPEDDLVLAAAVSAVVDFLVTGDRMLLRLGSYEGTAICSPRDFLTLLEWLEQDDEVAP